MHYDRHSFGMLKVCGVSAVFFRFQVSLKKKETTLT